MLKKITLFSLMMGCVGTMHAQITITSAAHTPQVGDTVTTYGYVSANPLYFSNGANQTWTIPADTNVRAVRSAYTLPSNTSDGSNHPNANIAGVDLTRDSSNTYSFADPTGYYLYGTFTRNGRVQYTKPSVFLRYPMTYQDVYSDNFYGTITSFTPQGNSTFARGGMAKVEATGYGDIVLPTGTLNNVLKVMYTTQYADTIGGFAFTRYADTVQVWYSVLSAYPVASYTVGYIYSGANVTRYGELIQYQDAAQLIATRRLEQPFSAVQLYPNPASDYLMLEGLPVDCQLRIMNANGQVVQEQSGISTDRYQLSTQGLPQGVYWLSIQQGKAIRTELFVVQ